ncbi:MAG: tetratricopeptide repeat protein [Deltaproteobacteria bacterium]|nr:tetratricopeptide repeat protein [Deltaproteobacteria bacterium]
MSENKAALKAFKTALSIYKKIGNTIGEANCISIIGGLLFKTGDYKSAENYFNKALKLYENIQDIYSIATTYLNYGRLFKENKDYKEKGIKFIKKAADIFDSINIEQMAYLCRRALN